MDAAGREKVLVLLRKEVAMTLRRESQLLALVQVGGTCLLACATVSSRGKQAQLYQAEVGILDKLYDGCRGGTRWKGKLAGSIVSSCSKSTCILVSKTER